MLVQQVYFKSNVVSQPNQQKVDSNKVSKNIATNELDTFQSENQTKRRKNILIAASIGILGVASALIAHKINSKPKRTLYDPLNYLFNGPKDEVQAKLHNIFNDIKILKGEQFINKAYEHIVNFYDYKRCAPEIKYIKNINDDCIICGYRPIPGIIEVDDYLLNNGSQKDILKSLWHEFTHFMQYSDIIRTKNIGIEGYIKTKASHSALKTFTDNKDCISTFNKYPEQLTTAEKDEYIQLIADGIKKRMNVDLYKKVIKYKGKIGENSEMARISQENLHYDLDYINASGFSDINYNQYKNNPLEKYAYRTDEYIGNSYAKFLHSNNKSPWE